MLKCEPGHIRDEFNNCQPDDSNTRGGDLEDTFTNADRETLDSLASKINKYGKDFGIDTNHKLRHFLAQGGHETGGFQNLLISENLNYSADRLVAVWPHRFSQTDTTLLDPDDYANDPEGLGNYIYCCRLGNGNEASGDGYRYRGRGIIQLTGRSNYEAFNEFYQANYDSSVDILSNPDLVASDELIAIISALWFYEDRVINEINIDEDTKVEEVTIKVNGGTHGQTERENIFEQTETEIDCAD